MKLMILLIIFFLFWNDAYDGTSTTEFRKHPCTLMKGVLCVYIYINQHAHEPATKSFDQQKNLTNKYFKLVNYSISFRVLFYVFSCSKHCPFLLLFIPMITDKSNVYLPASFTLITLIDCLSFECLVHRYQ